MCWCVRCATWTSCLSCALDVCPQSSSPQQSTFPALSRMQSCPNPLANSRTPRRPTAIRPFRHLHLHSTTTPNTRLPHSPTSPSWHNCAQRHSRSHPKRSTSPPALWLGPDCRFPSSWCWSRSLGCSCELHRRWVWLDN